MGNLQKIMQQTAAEQGQKQQSPSYRRKRASFEMDGQKEKPRQRPEQGWQRKESGGWGGEAGGDRAVAAPGP